MNTHIKKILAISLVIVMCLSALPMLAPSASAAPGEARGYVVLTFDDCYRSVYEQAYPLMKAAGIVGSVYMTVDNIGGSGAYGPFLTATDLHELQDAGWEIGSHGMQHTSLTSLSLEDAEAQFAESKSALEGMGFNVRTWAYPNGYYNEDLLEIGSQYYERQRGYGGTDAILYQYMSSYPGYIRYTGGDSVVTWADVVNSVDTAIATDSVAILTYHGIHPNGTMINPGKSPDYMDYTIQQLIGYISERMESDGLQVIRYCDLPGGDMPYYVWDGEGSDDLASNPENWHLVAGGTVTNDVPLANGLPVVFRDSTKDCTWDIDSSTFTPHAIAMMKTYGGNITQAPGVEIGIGPGGLSIAGGKLRGNSEDYIRSAGSIYAYAASLPYENKLMMTGDHTMILASTYQNILTLRELRVEADVIWACPGGGAMIIDVGAYKTLTIADGALLRWYQYYIGGAPFYNNGTIASIGSGRMEFAHMSSLSYPDLGNLECNLVISRHTTSTNNAKVTLTSPLITTGYIRVQSMHDTATMVVDAADYDISAGDISLGIRSALLGGSGTITTSAWDSAAGTWTPEESTVVLRDGGSAVLAPDQSFNALYIASDDGRTASWSMTAIGAQAPTVYGLRPGSVHTWYMDGVEQGEVTADANGTIALSYMSTGLHTLSVGPDPDAPAPISDMIGQYAWLIVGAAGVMALVVYAVAARHPLVLIVGIGLLLIAALLKTGVL